MLDAAVQMFSVNGYHETSIQDILNGANIARGTFYLHFDSKRAIFDELIDDFLGRIRGVITFVDLRPGALPPLGFSPPAAGAMGSWNQTNLLTNLPI